jgi:uncharacterized GH25 family protein
VHLQPKDNMKPWHLFCALLLPLSAASHEFWIRPEQHLLASNQPTAISLRVGERFEGDLVGFGQAVVQSMRLHHHGGAQDLLARVPPVAEASFTLAFAQPGAQLLAMDTHSFSVELPAAAFEAYLREEGLERVIGLRQAQGTSALPGRERYRRHLKALWMVGGQTDASHRVRTGQTLEIVPLDNPHTLGAGQALAVQVLHQGQPLKGALLKAWHRDAGRLITLGVRTNSEGQASLRLPSQGRWMLSVVHMVPATDAASFDWDSHWASLTFERPGPKTK